MVSLKTRLLLFAPLLILLSISFATAGEITGTASVTDGYTIEIHGRDIRLHGAGRGIWNGR